MNVRRHRMGLFLFQCLIIAFVSNRFANDSLSHPEHITRFYYHTACM